MTPLSLFHLNVRAATMLFEASTVASLRLMAMGGAVPARRGENQRMVDEKLPALMKSATAANKALMAGKSPDQVMDAALKPISQRVRANHKRLTK